MAITFPINPLHGQQYAQSGIPITWQFDSGRNAWRVLRVGTAWTDIVGKPDEFPPSDHSHEINEVAGLQSTLDGKQDISARTMPNGYPSLDADGRIPENQLPFGLDPGAGADWNDIINKPATFPPDTHSHPVAQISDSSSVGQQIVRAATGTDVLNIIGGINQDGNARVSVKKNGAIIGIRRGINLHEGTNVTMTVADDVANEEVDVTINAGGGSGGSSLIVTEVKPAAPLANDMWLDAALGILFIYYNDGTKSQWIESIPYMTTMPGTFPKLVFPVSPTPGQLYNPIPGTTWQWSSTRGVWLAYTTAANSYTTAEADSKFVDIVGDVMSGPLTVVTPPTADGHAASKLYVDGRLVVSDTPPAGAADGTLWWESDSGQLYIRYNDGSSTQWTVAVPQPDTSTFLTKSAQTLLAAEQIQARANIYAAPFDALAYNGLQLNGSMEVSQANGTNNVAINNTSAWTVDGWGAQLTAGGATGNAAQITTASLAPLAGFPHCLSVVCTSGFAAAGASDQANIYHSIEAFRWERLGFGYSSAQSVTISFWVHSTIGGNLAVGLRGASPMRTYIADVAITAGAWQYKSVTIPGDTAGSSWGAGTNGVGVTLTFGFASGSTLRTATPNTWVVGNFTSTTSSTNLVSSVNAAVRITGVTILPGSEAPTATQSALIARPFAEELRSYQRYLNVLTGLIVSGYGVAGNNIYGIINFPTMRTTPTVNPTGITLSNFTSIAPLTYTANSTSFYCPLTATGHGSVTFGLVLDARI